MSGMRMRTASRTARLTVRLFPPDGAEPQVYSQEWRESTTEPTIDLDFTQLRGPVQKARIELKDLADGNGHIHIREIQFR